jgi:hypothetical protein
MTISRMTICALILAAATLGGCANQHHPNYACRGDEGTKMGASPATPPTKDAAGDFTCE